MNIEQAIDIIYTGLVSEKSVPAQLISSKILDWEMLNQVMEALDFAIEYYKWKTSVPKKIAIAMVDIQAAFFFKSGFEEEMLRKLEDIGIELQEKALELFSEHVMIHLKEKEAYKLSELILVISNAFIESGMETFLEYGDKDLCIYTKGVTEYASTDLVCYIEDCPDINAEGKEIFPDFVVEEGLKPFYSIKRFQYVINGILHRKRHASLDEFIAGLNYYREHDDFPDL